MSALLDEPRLKVADARKADSLQRKALRGYAPGPWEWLKLKLSDARCEGCGRSLYGFNRHATRCGGSCRSRLHRLQHGAHTPERAQNQREGIDWKRKRLYVLPLIQRQIHTGTPGMGNQAYRTWGELALINPAHKALKPKHHVVQPFEVDSPPHPDNVAWIAAYRAGTLRARDSQSNHLAQMNHDPTRGMYDPNAVPDPVDHAASR